MSGKRGEAGGNALRKSRKEVQKQNEKTVRKALKKYINEKIPLVKDDLVATTGLSISTLNREPYKSIIEEHLQEEKVLLSPNGKQEVAELIRENRRLKEEIKTLKEMYNRQKKEIIYSKELFS